MAKAVAICKCAVCGETFEKEAYKQNRRLADEWERWAEENITVCPRCYAKEQREKEKAEGLVLTVSINPYDVKTPIVLSFSGDSYTYKDKIKELGYHWGYADPAGVFGFMSTKEPPKTWSKTIPLEQYDAEIAAAKEIGAKIKDNVRDVDIAAYKQVKAEADKKEANEKAKEQAIESEIAKLGDPPAKPSCLPKGRWNGRIYGKQGKYRIYISNKEIAISDDEAKQIKDYTNQKAEYNSKVKAIRG